MIYLDHAATSFPKPREVLSEMTRCMRFYGGNPGRGSHSLSLAAAEKVYACRRALTELVGSRHPERLAFTLNATSAINTVVKGLLRTGDHVLISDMEHNAVLRPVARLAREGRITYTVFPTMLLEEGRSPARITARLARLVRPNTRMLICAHASNVCSASLPLEALGEFCRKRGILFVVDAAQSLGHLPIDVEEMKIDALCAPGHKGLLGPQGSGFFLLGEGVEAETLIEGGSGYHSLEEEMPEEMPERYEAGTLPTPAIAGLLAGIGEVRRMGIDAIHAHECRLIAHLARRLSYLPEVTLYAPQYGGSVLSFGIAGRSAEEVGLALNRMGFCVRAGFHCSALGHRTLGTDATGTVRVSVGYCTTEAQIDALADAVERLCRRT